MARPPMTRPPQPRESVLTFPGKKSLRDILDSRAVDPHKCLPSQPTPDAIANIAATVAVSKGGTFAMEKPFSTTTSIAVNNNNDPKVPTPKVNNNTMIPKSQVQRENTKSMSISLEGEI